MKVIRLNASEVNGILNFDIKFNNDLSFLIGINGSGKTTALKLLLGLITPSYNYLSKISFKRATLECITDDNKKIKIIANAKEEDAIELELEIEGVSKAKNVVQFYERSGKYIEEEEEMMINRKFHHLKVVNAIQDLKTPVFLGLDRRIFQRKLLEDPRREYERRKFRAVHMGRRKYNLSNDDPMTSAYLKFKNL